MTGQERTYSSGEAAKKLGMSVQSLKRHRLLGNIEGTRVGDTNVYVYTEAQLNAAELTRKKPGPKTRKSDEEDSEKTGGDTTVMFKRSEAAACLLGAAL